MGRKVEGGGIPDVLAVAGFTFPESHIAAGAARVEMAEWLFG